MPWQVEAGYIDLVLGIVERQRCGEDRPRRLAGDHLSGTERSPVAEPLDLEANRFGVLPGRMK